MLSCELNCEMQRRWAGENGANGDSVHGVLRPWRDLGIVGMRDAGGGI